MAKSINSIAEILLLSPGASLEGLEARECDESVREFQRILGAGQLCEEVDIFDLQGADQCKVMDRPRELMKADIVENRAGLDSETASCLWPVLGHGDGHTFYYCPTRKRFIAHYHDPDILEDIGGSLAEAINVALDANFHFVPEDFAPVYWKPRSLYAMQFGAFGRRISPDQLLAATTGVPKPSHTYCGRTRADLIWVKEFAHVNYVISEDAEGHPIADARFYCFQRSEKAQEIMDRLRVLAQRLQFDIHALGPLKAPS